MKFISFATGYRTYITVAIGIGLGVAQALGVHIPESVDVILGFLGLGFHRAALQSETVVTTQQVEVLVKDILTQVTLVSDNNTPPSKTP